MDYHIKEYYKESSEEVTQGSFHRVIPLHDHPMLSWEEVLVWVPDMCRGWFELAHLSVKDRVEFTRDFWLSRLQYHPHLTEFMLRFFAGVDDIGIFITQKKFEDPYDVTMVYSLKDNGGFFRGRLPASETSLRELSIAFPDVIFPSDYLSFFRIHSGFSKATDCTGIAPAWMLWKFYCDFQEMLAKEPSITTERGIPVNPTTLIPFYESFGMPFFQCFWIEWYPGEGMGNVYYSGITQTISDIQSKDSLGENSGERMAFPTFLDWLMFYMERVG
jgi:hypothetical protein